MINLILATRNNAKQREMNFFDNTRGAVQVQTFVYFQKWFTCTLQNIILWRKVVYLKCAYICIHPYMQVLVDNFKLLYILPPNVNYNVDYSMWVVVFSLQSLFRQCSFQFIVGYINAQFEKQTVKCCTIWI